MRQPLRALPLAVAFFCGAGCKLLERTKKDDPKSPAGDVGTGSPVASGSGGPDEVGAHGSGSGSGAAAPTIGSSSEAASSSLRDVTYALAVTLQTGSAPAPVTYESVRDIVGNRCVQCHGASAALDLTKWPFRSRFTAPAEAVKEVLARVQNAAHPMPPAPSPALTNAEVQALKDWQAGGLKEKPDAAAAAVPFTDTVTAHVKARAAHATQDIEATFPWNGSGQFAGALSLPLYDTASVKVSIVGEDGTELATKTYDNLVIGPEGDLRFALTAGGEAIRAHVVDKLGPAVGGDGVVTASVIEETALTLNWGRATDQLSAPDSLAYAVYVADSDTAFATVDQVLANGRKAMDFGKNLTGAKISGLGQGRTYFFAIVVKDEAGNASIYKILKQATSPDKVPPAVPTPALVATGVTEARVTLAWAPAKDNFSAAEKLTYAVYFSESDNIKTPETAAANGTLVGTTKPGVAALVVKGMNPETTYFFNAIVVDENANRAAYATARVVTPGPGGPTQTVLDHGRQCAERLGTIKPFSCFDGQLLPIEVNKAAIPPNLTAAHAAQYHFGKGGANDPYQTCDKPPLLGLGAQGHCIPYTRIGKLKTYQKDGSENPNVDVIYTCRRYTPRLGQQVWQNNAYEGSLYPGFEDIAMIMHDRVSGESCFFQMLQANAAPMDGRRVPPPTEDALPPGSPPFAVAAKTFWLGPVDAAAKSCNRCHDSDPWMHSPYIDQARAADGKPFVPSGAFGGGRSGKYSVIGNRGFNKWQKSLAISSTVTTDTNGKSCTSCHNVGNINGCGSWARQSSGLELAANVTQMGATAYEYRYWMPPGDANVHSEADWQSSGFKRAAERLLACCNNPQQVGCSATPVMTVPPPYATD